MMPTPELKTGDIMDRIQGLPHGTGDGDFLVRSIQREISRVRDVSPADGYMLDGILFTVLRDFDKAVSAHRNAQRLGPERTDFLWNYSTSLAMFAHYKESRDVVVDMLRLGLVTDERIKAVLWMSLVALDLDVFDDLCRQYSSQVEDSEMRQGVEKMKETVETIRDFVSRSDKFSQDLKRLYGHVQSALYEKNAETVGLHADVVSFYGQDVLHLNYIVEDDAGSIIELNDALIDKVCLDEDLESWDSLVANFIHGEADSTDLQQGLTCNAGTA